MHIYFHVFFCRLPIRVQLQMSLIEFKKKNYVISDFTYNFMGNNNIFQVVFFICFRHIEKDEYYSKVL